MQCAKCKKSWASSTGTESKCPFCGELLYDDREEFLNQFDDMSEALEELVMSMGRSLLLQNMQLLKLLKTFCPQLKKEHAMMTVAVDLGLGKLFFDMVPLKADARKGFGKTAIERMHAASMAPENVAFVFDTFSKALHLGLKAEDYPELFVSSAPAEEEAPEEEQPAAVPEPAPEITLSDAEQFAKNLSLAAKGNAAAQFELARMYEEGRGTNKSPDEAYDWYAKAAERGDANALERMARYSIASNDMTKAIGFMRKAARRGQPQACLWLGLCAKNGENIKRDAVAAAEFLRAAAFAEIAEGEYEYGLCCEEGNGVDVDVASAFAMYKRASQKEFPKAEYRCGLCYENGIGVGKDYRTAVSYYRRAAGHGVPEAQFSLAYYYEAVGNTAEKQLACEWYEKAAKQGHLESMFRLGYCSMKGIGCAKDEVKGAEWYVKAAEDCHAEASYQAAICFENGVGVKRNITSMMRYLRRAADAGHINAQIKLAECYAAGVGTKQDYSLAIKWYVSAADLGSGDAQMRLARCYEAGNGVEKNYDEAMRWYAVAAENGSITAMTKMGASCEDGGDYIKAMEWYKKASESDTKESAEAQCRIGKLYRDGLGMRYPDVNESFRYIRLSADKGYPEAEYLVGEIYEKNSKSADDLTVAAQWYQLAAEAGNADAMCALGQCYEFGKGVVNDRRVSMNYYRKAAEKGSILAEFYMGRYYFQMQEYDQALRFLTHAEENGITEATELLSRKYKKKNGKWEKKLFGIL